MTMLLPILMTLALSGRAPSVQDQNDQTSHPLWTLGQTSDTLFLVDLPPAVTVPDAPVQVTFWLLEPEHDGIDATAGRLTVTCASRSFVAHNFSGYRGTAHIGTAEAQDASPEVVEPGTVFGMMVDHLCRPVPDRPQDPDFSNLEQAQTAHRGATP